MSEAGKRLIEGVKEIRDRVSRMKPASDMPKRGGWAPGMYMSHCLKCECYFIGDKRAVECADCAYIPPNP